MKKIILIAAATLLLAFNAQATIHVLTFHGIVTSVNTANPLMKVGDDVMFVIHYDSSNNTVNRTTAFVNESALNLGRTSTGVHVSIDSNPSDGTVQWAVGVNDGDNYQISVASNTPGGVIPCIDNFDLGKTFEIFFNNIIVNGSINMLPHDRVGY